MQSETIFVLFLVFIILIALVVLYVLYILDRNKYNETNTFYKNLLTVMKDDTNFNNVHKDLTKSDFDLNSLSQEDKNNILVYNTILNNNSIETQDFSNVTNNMISSAIANERKTNNNVFLKNSYEIYQSLSNNYSDLSNLKLGNSSFNLIGSSNLYDQYRNDYNSLRQSHNTLNNVINVNDENEINISCNLKVSDLSICDDDMNNCYNIFINEGGLAIKNSDNTAGSKNLIKFGDNDLVIDSTNNRVYHKNTFSEFTSSGNYKDYDHNHYIVKDYESILDLNKKQQKALYESYIANAPMILANISIDLDTPQKTKSGENSFNINNTNYYIYPFNKYFKPIIVSDFEVEGTYKEYSIRSTETEADETTITVEELNRGSTVSISNDEINLSSPHKVILTDGTYTSSPLVKIQLKATPTTTV